MISDTRAGSKSKMICLIIYAKSMRFKVRWQSLFERIKNFNVSVMEGDNNILFLRKLEPEGSEHSFGIHVAKMAGMPEKIINISKKILKKLENSHSEKNKFDVDENSDLQLSFFSLNDDSYQNLKGELESIDMDNMTPIEALVKLSELKQKINKDDT